MRLYGLKTQNKKLLMTFFIKKTSNKAEIKK